MFELWNCPVIFFEVYTVCVCVCVCVCVSCSYDLLLHVQDLLS